MKHSCIRTISCVIAFFYTYPGIGYTEETIGNPELRFNATFRSNWPLIKVPGTYNYEPSAMTDKVDGWKIWWCGNIPNSHYGDVIYYAQLAKNGDGYKVAPRVVLHPEDSEISSDSFGTCNPSVISYKNSKLEGPEQYYMYFECAPILHDRSSNNFGKRAMVFTEICLATGRDGIHWNKRGHAGKTRENMIDTLPEPILKTSSAVRSNCLYRSESRGQKTVDTSAGKCSGAEMINNYGVGHPSAVVINGTVWLFYYDSRGSWPEHGVYLTKSHDGANFDSSVKTNLPNGGSIKYSENLNMFVAITTIGSRNRLFYSRDGISWNPSPSISSQSGIDVGIAINGHCAAPGQNTIVGDEHGHLSSNSLNILSGEGYLGTSDNARPLGCYNKDEDSARGITWGIYLIKGDLSSQP